MMKLSTVIILTFVFLSPFKLYAEELYRINLGDILRLSVWKEEALQQDVIVLPDGTISSPLVRIVNASNRTPAEAWEELKNKLSRLIPVFEIYLAVSSTGGNNIFIVSRVNRPRRFS